jgi:hypothetical protein
MILNLTVSSVFRVDSWGQRYRVPQQSSYNPHVTVANIVDETCWSVQLLAEPVEAENMRQAVKDRDAFRQRAREFGKTAKVFRHCGAGKLFMPTLHPGVNGKLASL